MIRFIAILVLCLWPSISYADVRDGRLDIYWVDTEGGAATLIVTPAGESVLIDSGNPGIRDPQRIVKVATEVAGLRQIDHLIVTHYHIDHYGGAASVAAQLPIGVVHDNGEFDGMPNDPGKEYREFKCDKRVVINPGDKIPLKQVDGQPAIQLVCVGTRQKFVPVTPQPADTTNLLATARMKDRDGSDNANSVVTVLSFGGFRFFDAGDLTWNREHDVVCPKNLVGTVDVYQVTHHGLDSSNNPTILRALKPTVAIMNNGHKKGCMPEVFTTLKDTQSLQAVYQVHKNLRPGEAAYNVPDEFIANTEDDVHCKGNHIQLSVDPTGKTYVVKIPAKGHERQFSTAKH